MLQDTGKENFQRRDNLYKETRLGRKPFIHCVLPLTELPTHDYGSGLGLPMNPDFTRVVNFISNRIGAEEELRLALERPAGFAFRGFTRVVGSEAYESTIRSIEEHGVDRGGPNGNKTWFNEGEIDLSLMFAIPQQKRKVGFLIIFKAEGMTWGDDFSTEGVRLKEGYSFKSLHVGTVQIIVDPPMNK